MNIKVTQRCREAAAKAISPETKAKLHQASAHGEHWGFVAVAAVDAFHFHSLLFVVSIWLLLTGLAMELFANR